VLEFELVEKPNTVILNSNTRCLKQTKMISLQSILSTVSKEQIFASNQNANHEDGEVMLKNFLDLNDRIKIFVYWISENILILV
jgi:hypothetical protein